MCGQNNRTVCTCPLTAVVNGERKLTEQVQGNISRRRQKELILKLEVELFEDIFCSQGSYQATLLTLLQ